MNKSDLIAAMAAKTGSTKKDAEATLNAFVEVVTDSLVKGDKVQLVGFGSFEVRKRAARKGRNPQTKEEIKIPASKAPVFKAGKALKDLVIKKLFELIYKICIHMHTWSKLHVFFMEKCNYQGAILTFNINEYKIII